MPSLDFELQQQERSNWCWAAVTVSVLRFFSPESQTRQCGIAHDELDLRCCEDAERKCNQVRSLQPPLASIGRLRGEKRAEPLSFDEIRQEIDNGVPVCARIAWRSGGGHFVVISGYDILPKMGEVVIVDDPQAGRSRLTYEGFLSRYKRIGEWTHTYHLTRRARNPAAS
ncbi:MAG: C39 family peptidase [Acidobacteriia bacterium]|nr:C39 family peptidase [Terriglobia bacterium]